MNLICYYHFRGDPSAQGNSLLALAGLALVSTHHALSLGQTSNENQQKASEHIGHNRWLMVVIETLFSIIDGRYKAKGKVFNWCHQVGSKILVIMTVGNSTGLLRHKVLFVCILICCF